MNSLRPILDSYWVIPSSFMAGEYPGAGQESQAREKLRWLIAQGINTWIDLTVANEDGLAPYANWAIEEGEKAGKSIQYQRFSINDMEIPSHEEMTLILDAIDTNINTGRRIYVHCYGGVGRTGTVVGCYLVRHGIDGEQAIRQIATWRAGTPKGWRISPETEDQRQLIMSWREQDV